MDLPLISTGSKLKRIVDALAVAVVLAAMVAAARATGLDLSGAEPKLLPPEQALLYSGIGMFEATNLSVGRGTAFPFLMIGAPWIKGKNFLQANLMLPGSVKIVFVQEAFLNP